MGRKLYINNVSNIGAKAGSKAKSDINRILDKEGFTGIDISYRFHVPGLKHSLNALEAALLLKPCKLSADDLLCIQVPSWYGSAYDGYLLKLHRKTGFKLMVIIHDIEGLRKTEKYNDDYCRIEAQLLKEAEVIICHNETMKEYLQSQGIDGERIICLEIFDYMLDREVSSDKEPEGNEIIIAGNLSPEKSGFIYKLKASDQGDLKYNLYGYGFEGESDRTLNYCGCYQGDEVPYRISGKWGLVWDGTSAERIDGVFGHYLKYNNQHKASLYLAAKIPVIMWAGAGLSDFVRQNQVGICVDSLADLPGILSRVSEEEYQTFKKNAEQISQRLTSGYYAEKAIKKAVSYMQD